MTENKEHYSKTLQSLANKSQKISKNISNVILNKEASSEKIREIENFTKEMNSMAFKDLANQLLRD